MKKILLACLLLITMVVSLAACGGKDNPTSNEGNNNETPVHTHSFGEWSVTKNATCTEDGIKVRYCDCGEKQSESIPLKGHTKVVLEAISATCLTEGKTEGEKCSDCGEILLAQEKIDALGHKEVVDAGTDATCTQNGLTEGKHCSTCGEIIVAQIETIKKSHSFDSEYDESCNVCGFIRDIECAHLDLIISSAENPSCTQPGRTEGKVCSKCEAIILAPIIIPATGHSFADGWMYDNTYHWHGAICGHNDAFSNKVIHNLDVNGKCIVCDYQEQIQLKTPTITTVEYDKVYWYPVENATNYTATINGDYTYTTAYCSFDLSNATYNGVGITNAGYITITLQANGSGRYTTSDKSSEYTYYFVPEKQNLTSDETKLYNYGIGYGYNLIDYEAIDAEKISQIRVLNINKLLTLGEFYNPAITTGTVETTVFSSIDEFDVHISGSYSRNSGLNIPVIGGIKKQFKVGLGVDYNKYDYNQTYKVQEDFIYKTYGIKNYSYDQLTHCLTEMFINDIKLAETMDENVWLEYMYSKYGTHVILGVATGASYSATYTISTNKKDIAAQVNFELNKGLGLSLGDILSSDLGVDISLNGKADWSNEYTEAHFKIDWKGSTSGGATTPNNLDAAINNFESNINENNAVTIRFTNEGAISIGSLVSMLDASLGEKFESYVNNKGDEEFQKLYSQYTKPSTLPVSINVENGENVLRIDLSSYQNSGSLNNAYNVNLIDGIFNIYPKMLGKRVDKIVVEGAFDEYSNKFIDNFSIKLAKGWNKDTNVVVENIGVVSASEHGFVDTSDVSSAYNIVVEYRGINSIKEYGYMPYVRDENYIYFGEYPQTLKADDVTITDTVDSRGYYLGSDGCYYAQVTSNPNQLDYVFSTGATITKGTVYYFKVEPIRWRILSEENGEAFILCDSIIVNHVFDGNYSENDSNNYAESKIRAWLNSTFYETAFTSLQQSIILTTEVDNSLASAGDTSNPYVCENTLDKLFLLSYAEATNNSYGFSYSKFYPYDSTKKMLTSDYSRAMGAYISTSSDFYGIGYWWLRSSCDDNARCVRGVDNFGYIGSGYYVGSERIGVVPALRINL